ncbi:MAG: sigma-70 family RNA polymerase sigma factor [Actinobacteria bacterium]|nr:sigma-70 family RNA polymerase sigma factor [Actinomycetota bacterium]
MPARDGIRGGDAAAAAEAAVRHVANGHRGALLRWVTRRMGDASTAEEVVQETLVRAWLHHDRYDANRGAERAWLFGIARHVMDDHVRRSGRFVPMASPPESGDAESAAREVERAVEASLVREALDALSPDHCAVLVAAHFDGQSVGEIALKLGIPEGTVKSRLYYGLRRLRDVLTEWGVAG